MKMAAKQSRVDLHEAFQTLLSPSEKDCDETCDDSCKEMGDETSCYMAKIRWLKSAVIILQILVFVLSMSLLITWPVAFWLGQKSTSQNGLPLEQVTKYSPILEDIRLSYSVVQFNGSLLKPNIFRQSPSLEVDAAWDSLGVNYRALQVPSSLAQKAGLAPDQVKVNKKYGGGYPANVEGLHHLHCLNLLRQGLWYNFEYYHKLKDGAFKNEDRVLKFHMSHCLDILRQQLMCAVDIGVLGQIWIHPERPEPYVDFNTQHQCRDFEAVRKWAEERQMPDSVPIDWLEPPKKGDRIYEEMP